MASTSMGFSVGATDKASAAFEKVAQAVDGLRDKLGKLNKTTATPKVDLDDKALRSKVTTAEKRVADLQRRIEQDTPQLGLDIAELEAKQRKVTSDLDALRKKKVTPEVELKIAQGEAELGRLTTKLDVLGKKKVTPEVHAELAAAQAELAGFSAELAEVDRKRATAKVDVDTAGAQRKIATLDKSFGATTIRVAALARALSAVALPAAIVAASPYIASLGASAVQAAGALWLLPAAGAAGAIAIGALKVGMSGFGDAMKALGDPAKFAEAIAKLSPAARSAAVAIQGLVPAWNAMKNTVQDNLFAGVAGQIRALAGVYLPMLQGGLGQVASSLNASAMGLANWAAKGRVIADFGAIFNNVGTAMAALTPVATSIASIFTNIAVVGSGFLPGLASGFAGAAASAAAFVARARESGQLAIWIQNALNVLGQLGQIAVNVGLILGSLFGGAARSGESFLSILVRVTDQVARALRTPEGAAGIQQAFTTIRTIVGLFIDKLVILWPAISAAASALATMLQAAAPLSNVLFTLVVGALTPLLNLIGALAPVLGPALVTFGAIRGAIMLWTAAQWLLNTALTANPIGIIIVAIGALVGALMYAWNNSETFRNVVIGVWEAIKSAWSGVVNFFSTIFSAIGGFFTNIGSAIGSAVSFVLSIPGRIVSGFFALVTFFAELPGRILSFLASLPGMIAQGLGFLAGFLLRTAIDAWTAFQSGIETAFVNTVAFFVSLPARIKAFLIGATTWLVATAIELWNGFTAGLATGFVNVVAWFVALPGRIKAFFVGAVTWLVATAVELWNGFTAGLATGFVNVVAWFVALPGRIKSFFLGAAAWLVTTGIDLILGLWNGITGAFTGLMSWIGGLISQFIAGFMAGLGIASPSTIFAQIGTYLIQGLIAGIQAAAAWLWSIVTTIATGLVNTIMAGIQGLAALWAAVWNGIVAVFQWVWGLIQTVAMTVWGAIYNYFAASFATFSAIFSAIWNGIVGIFSWVWTTIQTVAMTVWGAIYNYFAASFAVFSAIFSAIWNGIVAVFSFVWNTIRTVALTVWGAIQAYFTASFAVFSAIFSAVWNAIVAVFSFVWNTIRTVAVTVWTAIQAFFTTAFAVFQAVFSAVWNAVVAVFTFIWNTIRTVAITVWTAIQGFFTTAFAVFQAFFAAIWNAILLVFTTVWNFIRNTAMTIWNSIYAFFVAAFTVFSTFFATIWNAILAFFTNTWNFLRNVAVTAWNTIYAFFQGAFAAFSAFFASTWQGIVDTFGRIWGTITGIAQRVWDGVKNAFRTGVNAVIDVINIFADGINKVAGLLGFQIDLRIPRLEGGGPVAPAPRTATSTAAGLASGGPVGLASGGSMRFRRGGKLPYTGANRDTIPAYAGSQPYALMGEEYVVRRSSTRAIGSAGMAAVNNADRSPVDIVPRRSGGPVGRAAGGPVLPEEVVRDRAPFLSALADQQAEAVGAANAMGGVNKLLTRLADGDSRAEKASGRPRRTMPGYRKQFSDGMLSPIARDLGGAIAFAKSMSGKPYIWGGTTTAGTDCSGYQGFITNVLRNRAPARIGTTASFPWPGFTPGLTSKYAVGAFKGNPGHMAGTLDGVNVESGGSPSRVKYGAGAVGADNGQFNIKASLPEVGGVFASGGAGGGGFSMRWLIEPILKPIYDALVPIRDDIHRGYGWRSMAGGGVKLMDGILAYADTLGGGGGGGGNVENWRPLVNAALGRVGQPANNADVTLRRMAQESGGDPRAINNWDSNARKGTPSKGLMQVIDPTFQTHRDRGLPNDIWDPMANVVASMRYTLSKYGSLPAGYGRPGGYDSGGIARGKGLMMKDVITPERVLSGRQTQAFEQLVASLSAGRPQAALADLAVMNGIAAAQGRRTMAPLAGGPGGLTVNIDSLTTPPGTTATEMAGALRSELRVAKYGGVHR